MDPFGVVTVIHKEDTLWFDKAACAGKNTELFFVDEPEEPYPAELKGLCKNCPVNNDCLQYAIKYRMQGYWGGTTDAERKQIKRKSAIIRLGSPSLSRPAKSAF